MSQYSRLCNQDRIVCMQVCFLWRSQPELSAAESVISVRFPTENCKHHWCGHTTDQVKPNHAKPDQEKQHAARQLPQPNSDQHAWVHQSSNWGEETAAFQAEPQPTPGNNICTWRETLGRAASMVTLRTETRQTHKQAVSRETESTDTPPVSNLIFCFKSDFA